MLLINPNTNAPIMADTKPSTWSDCDKFEANKRTAPSITKVNNPRVSIVMGSEKNEIMGFTNRLIKPRIAEAHRAPVNPVIDIPPIR